MHTEHHKEYSSQLGRDMEFKVYGHGGKPTLVFPCQNGRFFDWEGFGMLDTLGDYLDQGKLQLFTVDTIDAESVSLVGGDPYSRVRRHKVWYLYITEELVPWIREINGTGQNLLPLAFPWAPITPATSFSAGRTCSTASSPSPVSMTPTICTTATWTRWSTPTIPVPASPGCRPLYPAV